MTAPVTTDWIAEHFAVGWYMKDNGDVFLDDTHHGVDPRLAQAPLDPIWHTKDGTPIYSGLRQRLIDHGEVCPICPICRQPSWAVTRHAAERHGADVEVFTGTPLSERPDWFHPDWI